MDSRDDRHELALVLARHQRIDPPSAHCTCDPHGEEVVRLGQLFSKHLVEVVQEAGWVPKDTVYRAARQRQADAEHRAEHFRALGAHLRGERDAACSALAAAQARNATLTDTIQRVEALCELPDPDAPAAMQPYAITLTDGVHMVALVDDLRAALGGPGEEDAYTPAVFRRDDSGGDTP